MPDGSLSFLNVFEVEIGGVRRHLIGLIEQVRAGAQGIPEHAIVGEFTPRPDGSFDPSTFRPNPAFVAAFTEFMNAQAARAPELMEQARSAPAGRLEVLDPRCSASSEPEPPPSDVVGSYAIDPLGRIIPGSFAYSPAHHWFSPATGVSGFLTNRPLYDWLHNGIGTAQRLR